jgi:hypothetical protein
MCHPVFLYARHGRLPGGGIPARTLILRTAGRRQLPWCEPTWEGASFSIPGTGIHQLADGKDAGAQKPGLDGGELR